METVDIGTTPNDGTGDPHRTAFEKINGALLELAGRTGGATALTRHAWFDPVNGDDATASVGAPFAPYATLQAAHDFVMDGATEGAAVIHIAASARDTAPHTLAIAVGVPNVMLVLQSDDYAEPSTIEADNLGERASTPLVALQVTSHYGISLRLENVHATIENYDATGPALIRSGDSIITGNGLLVGDFTFEHKETLDGATLIVENPSVRFTDRIRIIGDVSLEMDTGSETGGRVNVLGCAVIDGDLTTTGGGDAVHIARLADVTGTVSSTSLEDRRIEATVSGGGGGGGSGTTNLSVTQTSTTVTVLSDTGTDATLPAADGTNAGVLTAASYTKLSGIETGAEVTSAAKIAAVIHAGTSKATPVDGDELPLSDSAASYGFKKLTWANIKATLKTYFDGLYSALADRPVAPVTLTYGASLTPDCADGLYRKVTMSGNATLNAPTNGSDGKRWRGRFTASGANRDLTIDAAIKIPSDSTFTGTKTIASGETYLVQLEYMGSAWVLQSLVGGWA